LTLAACALFFLGSSTVTFAQQKIGHIDTQEVLKLMPERDSASKVFDKFNNEITRNYEEMTVNYRNMVDVFTKQRDSLSSFIQQAKEAELVDMQGKIQNFREVAQQELDKKQQDLMAPIVEKMKKAIKEVAESNKFTYVIDTQMSGLWYLPADESLNLLPLVKAKLGLK
jgi:outer membrane protein